MCRHTCTEVTFDVREEAVGIGQDDSIAKYGIGESVGRSGEILEDDYGISVIPERFVDIVTGVDPSKFSGGSGRIGEDVLRRGLGFGADGRPVLASSGGLAVTLRTEGQVSVKFSLIQLNTRNINYILLWNKTQTFRFYIDMLFTKRVRVG